jgi:transcriptional regulator with XRE-family HTH domain
MRRRARSKKAEMKADLGKAIVFLADRSGLSQSDLAKKASMSSKAISGWSGGKSSPSSRAMEAVLAALKCTEDEVEAATAIHREWRLKLRQRTDSNLEIKEAPGSEGSPGSRGAFGFPGLHGSSPAEDERHREVGRTVEWLLHLLLLALPLDRQAPRP